VAALTAARVPAPPSSRPRGRRAPHLAERQAFSPLTTPGRGAVRITAVPFHVDHRPVTPAARALSLGEHTRGPERVPVTPGANREWAGSGRSRSGGSLRREGGASAAPRPIARNRRSRRPNRAPASCKPGSAAAPRSIVSIRGTVTDVILRHRLGSDDPREDGLGGDARALAELVSVCATNARRRLENALVQRPPRAPERRKPRARGPILHARERARQQGAAARAREPTSRTRRADPARPRGDSRGVTVAETRRDLAEHVASPGST